jgi:hypothetical protein
MKPIAVYEFGQCPEHHTRYKLNEHRGGDIPGFPAIWQRGKYAGQKYIGFRETVNNKPGHRHFSHTIELEKARTVTGLNFTLENPRRAYGDFGTDGLLIEFSDTWDTLKILFFRGQKETAQSLFQKWLAGEVSETLEADTMPLPYEAIKKAS